MTGIVLQAARELERKGISARIVKINRLTPIDTSLLNRAVQETGGLCVIEEVAAAGGLGERIAAYLTKSGRSPKRFAAWNTGNDFVTQGTVDELRRLCGLDADSIVKKTLEVLEHG